MRISNQKWYVTEWWNFPSTELDKCDWIDKFQLNKDNVPQAAMANESSPQVTLTLLRKDCPDAPSKKSKKRWSEQVNF